MPAAAVLLDSGVRPASHERMEASAERERREAVYSGRVQGVGFRMTACRVAARFAVSGYVRNLPDGRVRLVAEGEPAEIDRLLDGIREVLGPVIRGEEIARSKASGEFSGFSIRS